MYFYCGNSDKDNYVDIVDEDTLIKTEVDSYKFVELLLSEKIKPNAGNKLLFYTKHGISTVEGMALIVGDFCVAGMLDTLDGHSLRDDELIYCVSNGRDNWRNKLNTWMDYSIYTYFDGYKLLVWYKDYLHTIVYSNSDSIFLSRYFLGIYIENSELFCRYACNESLEYVDLHICGKDTKSSDVELHVEKCTLGNMKRMLLL